MSGAPDRFTNTFEEARAEFAVIAAPAVLSIAMPSGSVPQQRAVGRPSRWSAVGPAILLTATSVGAGDILTGSLAGAAGGTAVLWAVPAGIVLKWTLTEGIARWQMATGTTLLDGWVNKLGRWIQWLFFGYLLLFSLVTGGMLASACGVAGAALLPLGDAQFSRLIWAAVHALAGLALVWLGGYALLKKVLAVCVGAMFVTVTATAFLLAPDWNAVGRGLIPSLSANSIGWTIGLIGAIGGTMALISYGYWIREEGRTGKEGLRACQFDLLLSYAVIGVFGAAVVIIGSRVELQGKGTGLAILLADQLAKSLGPGGRWIFLVGFWAAVFSALLGVWQSLPYLFADFLLLRSGAGLNRNAIGGRGTQLSARRDGWTHRSRAPGYPGLSPASAPDPLRDVTIGATRTGLGAAAKKTLDRL